jgi:pentose-5-phosphate-3-epimerase
MTRDYKNTITGFRPQFGNANHIAAARIVPKITRLQQRIDKLSAEKRTLPKPLLKEIEQLEQRVVLLLNPSTPLSTYPPSFPQDV